MPRGRTSRMQRTRILLLAELAFPQCWLVCHRCFIGAGCVLWHQVAERIHDALEQGVFRLLLLRQLIVWDEARMLLLRCIFHWTVFPAIRPFVGQPRLMLRARG